MTQHLINQAIPTKVLVVEDQSTVRRVIVEAIHTAFAQCDIEQSATITQSLRYVQSQQFDLVLLDLSLPDGSGLDALPDILQLQKHAKVVVCTTYDDDDTLFRALGLGASGYLIKEQSLGDLASQLTLFTQGYPPLSASIANRMLTHFSNTPQVCADEQAAQLTKRETEVLQLIAKGLLRKQVSMQLQISEYTVADYIKNIYQKLNISSRAEATIEAARRGLLKF